MVKCPQCNKTVYENEALKLAGGLWHTWCCYCPAEGCGTALDQRTAKSHAGKIYCKTHCPKPKATQVADDSDLVHAKSMADKLTHAKDQSARTAQRPAYNTVQRLKAKNAMAQSSQAKPSNALGISKSPKCPKCNKSVFQEELIRVSGMHWHSWCCVCPAVGCGISLDSRTAMAHEGQVYCKTHYPKPKATFSDEMLAEHASKSQAIKTFSKEDSERSHVTDKDKPNYSAEMMHAHASRAQAVKTHAKEDSERSKMA